jgi:nucleosome binding factor SPN SPT16 subunit
VSSGVYSVLHNEWVVNPSPDKEDIDEAKILEKGEYFAKQIDSLIEKESKSDDTIKQINDLKDKIKKFRQSGLEKGGEYSYENLTFKLLRRNGYIKKLMDLKNTITDKKLSLR